MEVPVYLVLGMLESGKTHFLRDALLNPNFTEDERTLIIACEEGEEEYDEEEYEEEEYEEEEYESEEYDDELSESADNAPNEDSDVDYDNSNSNDNDNSIRR